MDLFAREHLALTRRRHGDPARGANQRHVFPPSPLLELIELLSLAFTKFLGDRVTARLVFLTLKGRREYRL
jgi:hypothetical protein